MIFSDNRDPQLPAFRELMKKTDALLNQEALGRERDVYDYCYWFCFFYMCVLYYCWYDYPFV